MQREYGRAKRGEKVYGRISGRKFKRVNIVAGKCEGKILAPLQYGGTTDSAIFEAWFEHRL
ncbi:MAG: IS630 family transposase, partial [Oscillospiraceae bacterium]|nr:IS630 family transposase [Oscillospiraceae bacterium]